MKNNNDKPMSNRKLMREISSTTNLKEDIVKSVMDCFRDIMIRECVMNGKFKLHNGFVVDNHTRSERKQYNVQTGRYIDYPETSVLNISLAPKINNFYRWKQRHEFNQKHGLTVEDWQKMKKALEEITEMEENDETK